MTVYKRNIMQIDKLPDKSEGELFEEILRSKNLIIERIISSGWNNADGEWYDQENDEWVMLIKGKAVIEFEDNRMDLSEGDYLMIPAHCRHKVIKTSPEPPCIWLAVHINK